MKNHIFSYLFLFGIALFFTACKKDKNTTSNNNGGGGSSTQKEYLLTVENGGMTIEPNQAVSYKARLIDKNGNTVTPSSINWTTSNSDVATIASNGALSVKSSGIVTVTVTAQYNSATFTATAPLQIATPAVFAVAPGAIIMMVGEEIQLNPVYLNAPSTPSYAYQSSTASVASVTSGGLVKGLAGGNTQIQVTSTTSGGSSDVIVPVLVIGVPDVVLPVVRVDVNPDAEDIFKGDTKQFTAKAFNSNNQQVSEAITWSTLDPSVATVNSSGLVTGVKIGETKIQAMAKGIIGEATITVNPDTVIIVSPFYATVAPSATKQFTAQAYNARTNQVLSAITNFNWEVINYGTLPGFEFLNIGTISSTGLLTVKNDALPGLSAPIIAYLGTGKDYGGVAVVQVQF